MLRSLINGTIQRLTGPSAASISPNLTQQSSSILTPIIMRTDKRYATKKMGASKALQQKRPEGKRLGMKKFPGEFVGQGNILMRQRGMRFHPGKNVQVGRDHTIYALMDGYVHITHDPVRDRRFIHVLEYKSTPEDTSIETMKSKVSGGWRNTEIYQCCPETGRRIFELIDLKTLPSVDETDLSAVKFDPMKAHLKGMHLDKALGGQEGYQFPERFKRIYEFMQPSDK